MREFNPDKRETLRALHAVDMRRFFEDKPLQAGLIEEVSLESLKISVVIPTYNRWDLLAVTLPTVLGQDFAPDEYEVIVAVDGSTDATVEFLRSLRPRCSLQVIEQANRGQGAARNAGLRAARGRLILLLDDDLRCEPTLLAEHAAAHEGKQHVLVAGPILQAPESPATVSAYRSEKVGNEWAERIAQASNGEWPLEFPAGRNVSVSRTSLLACGGFDERLLRNQDLDLALRLRALGFRLCYRPAARAYELYVKSAGDVVRNDAKRQGTSSVLLCRKHPFYRPFALPARVAEGRPLKRVLREIALRMPFSPEPLLRLPFLVAQRFQAYPRFRQLALRILDVRMGVVGLRSAQNALGSWQALRREFGMRLPVLAYHRVGPVCAGAYPRLTVSPERFESQMQWLARRGYTAICVSEWIAWCREGRQLPPKPVLITFDDGYADIVRYALPVLKRYGLTATVFVVTQLIGGTNRWDAGRWALLPLMNAEEIREWAAEGIEFGSHSRSHVDLTKLPAEQVEAEIAGSAADLECLVGSRPAAFAYPYGFFNESVRECASRVFDLCFTVQPGINCLADDRSRMLRLQILPGDTLLTFATVLASGSRPLARWRQRIALRTRLRAAARRILRLLPASL